MTVENDKDLLGMMAIGRICGEALLHMAEHLEAGMTTAELDAIGAEFLDEHGAVSAPITAYKFPGHTCISINDEAAHGIPGDRVIQPGDLVNIDVSAVKDGYWGDTGRSFPMPPVSPEIEKLVLSTEKALEIAIEHSKAGVPVNKIGREVERFARRQGYYVIEELGGHGVGRHIHEKPSIPNFYNRRNRDRLKEGMVVTLEPFLTTGARHVKTTDDGWTLKTRDGSLSAQIEHTVIITRERPILVTAV